MTLTVGARFGPNDLAQAPQARLHGGPFHDSVIELTSKDCSSITVTEDGEQAIYINSHTKNSEDQLVFTCEE